MSAALLEVADLHAYYGKSHILQGVSFRVDAGEVVSLLGRNGVGRSTTVRALMGVVAPKGSIRFKGEDIAGLAPHQIARGAWAACPRPATSSQASPCAKTSCWASRPCEEAGAGGSRTL